jgi:Nuclear pore assembly and biogenesis
MQALHIYNSCDPYLRPVRRFVTSAQQTTYPVILPYLNRAAVLAQDSPAILSVGVLLLLLLIAMQVLNFIRRLMVFWFRLCVRLAFWAVVVLVISAVWQRGLQRTMEDLVGWGMELGDVWQKEYKRWDGYQNQHRSQSHMGRTQAKASWR